VFLVLSAPYPSSSSGTPCCSLHPRFWLSYSTTASAVRWKNEEHPFEGTSASTAHAPDIIRQVPPARSAFCFFARASTIQSTLALARTHIRPISANPSRIACALFPSPRHHRRQPSVGHYHPTPRHRHGRHGSSAVRRPARPRTRPIPMGGRQYVRIHPSRSHWVGRYSWFRLLLGSTSTFTTTSFVAATPTPQESSYGKQTSTRNVDHLSSPVRVYYSSMPTFMLCSNRLLLNFILPFQMVECILAALHRKEQSEPRSQS
jgi:hypothetical protein